MIDWSSFAQALARAAGREAVQPAEVLFGEGLDLSSIAFTEFIMDLEEEHGLDIDVDDLDAGIVTAGQLFDRIVGA